MKTCAWHLYAKGASANPGTVYDKQIVLDIVLDKRTEFMALSLEEKEPWEDAAAKARTEARIRQSPVAREAASQLEAEVPGGPWSLSTSRGGMPGDWPLHRSHICRTMEKATLTKVAKEWGVAHSAVGEAADDFPVTVDMKEPCKVGECLHALTPRQRDRHGIIIEELKLALRHSGLPAHSPLLFELICGLEVRYCLIGDNDWTYNLRCDILLAEIVPRRRPGSVVPFELALQKETASGQMCDCGWPKTRSETMFVVNLVTFSSDPWHIYALHAEPDQPFSYIVTDKTKLDAESMREADLERLGQAYALRLLEKY